jgi:hypothetical protein
VFINLYNPDSVEIGFLQGASLQQPPRRACRRHHPPATCGFSGAIATPLRLLPLTGKPSTQTLKPGKEKGNLKLKPLNSNLVATPSTSPLCSPAADGIWVRRGILMSSSSFKRHFRGGVKFRGGGWLMD